MWWCRHIRRCHGGLWRGHAGLWRRHHAGLRCWHAGLLAHLLAHWTRVCRWPLILQHVHQVRIRRRCDAPVPVIRWQQNVGHTRLGCVGLLTCHADEDGRAMRLCALCRDRVALLNGGHHLAGCLVDVVLAVVLVFVFDPAFVYAIAVAIANPLIPLLGKRMAKRLKAFCHAFAFCFWVFDFDLYIDLLGL